MKYEWDEAKRASNIEKHGVDFVNAKLIFDDEHRIEMVDDRQDYGEQRRQTIGKVAPNILFVVFTVREQGQLRRIISARTANRKERQLYLSLLSQE